MDKPIRNYNTTALVVEDHLMQAFAATAILKLIGVNVIVAPDGETAVANYYQNNSQIGFVLLDIGLPDMSGFEVMEKMRSLDKKTGKKIPIFANTAHLEVEDMENRGFDATIIKPLNINELIKILDKEL